MPISEVSICNHALDLLGGDPILSLDDDTRAGRLCRRNYERCRDAVLRAYPWNPAIRRASLAALVDAPAWGFLFQYALPEGPEPPACLRVLQLEDEIAGRAGAYRIEGRRLLSNDGPPLNIAYIGRIADPNEFGPLLADAISARLAAELAYALTGSSALGEAAAQSYRAKLAEARAVDAQEGSAEPFAAGEWLESRM